MPRRTEPWHKVLVVLSGGARIESRGGSCDMPEDMLILIPAGTEHRLVDLPGREAVVAGLCLDASRLSGACGESWPILSRRLGAGVRLDRAAREAFLRLVGEVVGWRRARQPAAVVAAWGRALVLLALASRLPGRRKTPEAGAAGLRSALAWLDDHFTQPVSVGELAARAGLSYRGFTGQVIRATGETVLGRIVRLRLERAALLLRSGMPVTTAALTSGFGDLSGFYRHFRRHFGAAPAGFRPRRPVM